MSETPKTHKKPPPEPFECQIEKLVFGGWGLTHHAGKTVFVANVADHEQVVARIYKKAKGVRYAEMNSIITPNAEARVQTACVHAGSCGGCSYQHLSHDYQIKTKRTILSEAFRHSIELGDSILSPTPFHYRNKMEYGFTRPPGGEITYGLHPRGRFRHIIDLSECQLIRPDLWQVGQIVKNLIQTQYPYDSAGEKGFWQHLTLRQSFANGAVLVTLEVENPLDDKIPSLAAAIRKQCPIVTGVLAKRRHGAPSVIDGSGQLEEIIGQTRLHYRAENFFQVNVAILPALIDQIASLVTESKAKIIYDLFSGVGMFGITVAQKLGGNVRVIAAESDYTAAQIANDNAQLNRLSNYQSIAMDLYQKGWGAALRQADQDGVLIIDPPRAGLTNNTIAEIAAIQPKRIIYISCNPTTQKRDTDWLLALGYQLKGLRLIDMFPQTYHLESLAWLDRE